MTNKGCTFTMIGMFALILGVAWLHDQSNKLPPMSDEELDSRIARYKAERRQRCIDNVNSTVHLWPKELQKNAADVIRRCASDDD
ncbi:hypothetical protein [Bradyrhizobium quebecense]|uniref:Uncharacterized protein n=2 Tax=Bradyrhizobium quebecense TaxID=2748629 RepID=A0ABS3MEB2_9BRAD|nr:hypothetical protein [Bradyrhizobium quebecense]UGY05083.1 hypothetical protein J4P68_0010250 [Bradyrhizobium quebecense]